MKRTARSSIFAAITVAALVLAGCSSDADTAAESSAPAAEETTAETETETAEGDGAASECVAASQAVVDKWTAEVPLIGPSQQIDMAANAGCGNCATSGRNFQHRYSLSCCRVKHP